MVVNSGSFVDGPAPTGERRARTVSGRGLRANLHRLLPGSCSFSVRLLSSVLDLPRAGFLTAFTALLASSVVQGQTFLMADGAQWETCTGTFYDSGGAAGNYGSSQSMTATLCPTGGAGSGPFSSVTFTAWSISLTDILDNLVIHNGASAADPVLATGSLLNSLLGQTFTSTDPSGCLTFVWTSDPLLNGAGWAAEINTGPDAGGNGAVTICSSAADFDLFGALTGSPDAGGQWTFGGNLVSNTFSPATSPGGVYTYTVPGVAPCVDASATVTVTKVTAADAGFNNSIEVCTSEGPFSLRSRLLGTPQTGGTWTLAGNSHGDQFNPASDAGGVYLYLVAGTVPCVNATAQLAITLVQAPNAGINGILNVCSTALPQDLLASLGGTPGPGGTWTRPGNLPHSGQFVPGTDPAGVYTYTIVGQSPCSNASATVTVSVQAAASPGVSNDTTVCSNGAAINLKNILGTTATGTWTGISTIGVNNLYSPATMTPGTYTFTVAATGVCPSTSATVAVNEVLAPDAGNNGTLTVCSSGASVDLFTRLGGTPNAGGSWAAPGSIPFPTGVFIPGTSIAGTYTYTVTGSAPCANDQATVIVTQVEARNAGTNGSLTTCSNSAPSDMFLSLGGSPQSGGTWYKPVPPGGTVPTSFYNPASPGLPAGVYTYVLTGTAPCPNDSATVTVVRNVAPNAGTNGSLTLCNTGATVDLIGSLGGAPGGTGTWLNPSNQPFPTGQFNPASGTTGIYKYIITGIAPCINDTGFVTVNVNVQPNAGFSGDTTVCGDGDGFPLLSVLNGAPGAGGQWSPCNGTYDPGAGQAGSCTYTITAIAPCVNATAVATVTEIQRPNAGGNGAVTLCSTEPALNLFGRLTGSPQPGGTWSPGDPSGVYTPGTSTDGVYTYTLPGTAPCANSTATVTVTENTAPDPGTDATVTICAGPGTLNLFAELGGTPDPGGIWTSLDNITPGSMTNGLFTHTGVVAGDYDFRYTVNASGGCPGDFAEVRVTITATLDAGTNANCSVCRTNTAYNLFGCLNGTPQLGGSWKRWPGGTTVSEFYNASADAPGGPYIFRYYLTGSVGCQTDSAQVNITVVAAPEAGPPTASVTFCGNGPAVALITNLPGAMGGGEWRKLGQPNSFSGNYEPPLSTPFNSPGLFFYIVPGISPCGADTARLTVTEVAAPNAGSGGTVTRCILSPAFNMTQQLNGSPAANGVWTTPLGVTHSSTFVPGVDQGGAWTYTVPGTLPCSNGTAVLNIIIAAQPNAGLDGAVNVCSDANGFNLISQLNGTPGLGGTWYDSTGAVVTSQFFDPDPATTGENEFIYVVTGTAPCVNDTARLTIFESKEADAGITTTVEHCPTNGALDLFNELGGDPDATGTWSNGFNGTYVPGINVEGPYTYTVTGVPPCASANATVTVVEVDPPFAGLNTSALVCTSDAPFALISALDGGADPGGIWNGQSALVFFDPDNNAPGTYSFEYVVEGDGTCQNDTATLTVILFEEADAGCSGALQLCSASQPTPLFPSLGCSPQPGGTWTTPGGLSHTGVFNPATDPVGAYKYRRPGNAACSPDSATVTVTLVQQPNAGGPGQVAVCSIQASVQLINVLSGSPQPGGAWLNPQGVPHSGIYVPQFDGPGIYTYTLVGTSPCSNASSQVNVIEYQRPFAGNDGFRQVCSDEPGTFPLITVLTGGPNPIGSWTTPAGAPHPSGTFDPGLTIPGVFTYVVEGNAPCPNDTARATILQTTAANAGISTAVQVCNTAGGQSLNDLLGGTPDPGGSWQGPDGEAHSSTFNPSVDPGGTYTYLVNGVAPCESDSATVTVTLISAPNAGTDGALSACVSDNSVALFEGLGGSPQPTGTWTGANQVNGIFNATEVVPGTYSFTYSVTGGGSCPVDQATVTVTVANALDAGNGGSGEVCSGTDADLFSFLTGAPQPGGIWVDLDNTNAVDDEGVFDASIVGVGQYDFRYVLPGSANCDGDSAVIQITVIPGPNAGTSDPISQVCSDEDPFDLTLLVGSADQDGQWYGPDMAPHADTFDPASDPGGLYTYVVQGIGGCANDSATVNIVLNDAPEAGSDGSLDICSDDLPANLFALLGGSPDTGGTWTCCGGTGHSQNYNPLVDVSGNFEYTVTGQGACADDVAIVEVEEQPAPYAGVSDTYDACSSEGPFGMFQLLAGFPQSGGTWTDPDGAPHSATFNPAVDSSGVYTYSVTGGAACDPATATLTVSLTYAPNAGEDSTLAACNTGSAVDVFAALGPDADTGGTWTDVTGVGSAFQDGVLDASVVGLGTYLFAYSLPGNGPCLGDADTVTVIVGEGSDPGIGGTDTICGGDNSYDMFNSLGGSPDAGGVWTSGSVPGVLTGNLLDASLLPQGGPYPFSYTVTDQGCGETSSVVDIYVSEFADPGSDTTITVCSTANPFGLFNLLGGDPDPGGNWTTLNGVAVSATFDPASDNSGSFRYNLNGDAPCNDTSAVITVTVNDPPNAGADAAPLECNSGSLEMNTLLLPDAQAGGSWIDNGNTGLLTGPPNNPLLDLGGLAAGVHPFTYLLTVPSCGTDMASYLLTAVEAVRVTDTVLVCNEQDRTYTVSVTIEGGDPATYIVTGLEGTITAQAPYIFSSLPLLTSQDFNIIVTDTNDCGPRVVEGGTPCVFEDAVFVPESFTPNGDGANDVFVIPGIEGYPNNTIDIFNRWGGEVFSGAGYDNKTVVWDGTAENALLPGDPPTGTYYYVLELGNGTEPLKGFVYLNR